MKHVAPQQSIPPHDINSCSHNTSIRILVNLLRHATIAFSVFFLSGCWQTTDWETELFVADAGKFDFQGQTVSVLSQASEIGCTLKAELLPQKRYGFRNISKKGPYKLKVFTESKDCSGIHLALMEVFHGSQGNKKVASNYDKQNLIRHDSIQLYYHIYNEIIDVEYSEEGIIFVKLNVVKSNSSSSVVIYKFNARRQHGVTTIPIFTT